MSLPGSEISSEGSIEVAGTIKTIKQLEGTVDAVMYKTTEGSVTVYNYVSPDSVSGGTEYEISGTVTISTPISGELKFTGTSGSTVKIDADIKSGSFTLANVTIEIEPGREISATFKDENGTTIKIEGKAGNGFRITSSGSTMEIAGKMEGESELTVSSEITANSVTVSKMEVESGGSIIFRGGSIVTELSVTGTVTVGSGASLKSDLISIFGSLFSSGDVAVERILVGDVLDSIFALRTLTLGAAPTVAGSVAVGKYMVAGPGSDVSGVTGIDRYGKTSYFAQGDEYVTVYAAPSSGTKIGIIGYHPVDAECMGWYAGDRASVDVSESAVGDHPIVNAIIDYDIYAIAIAADKAVSKVFIDGEPMVKNADGTWSASVAAGSHEVTYRLKIGYSGTGVLASQSGGPGTISVNGTDVEVHGDRSGFILTLSGFSWTGWVEPEPDPPILPPTPVPPAEKKEGTTAEDCLLVVLIGMIAIMTIVLAGRMLKR